MHTIPREKANSAKWNKEVNEIYEIELNKEIVIFSRAKLQWPCFHKHNRSNKKLNGKPH